MDLMIKPKKRSTGRKKIEIKQIEKKENRQVCFTKRRQGLFKKANELCTLCGAEVAIVVFSLAGKPYSFGHPTVDDVLRRFLDAPGEASDTFLAGRSCSDRQMEMRQDLAYLRENLQMEMRRSRELEEALKEPWPLPKPFWWDSDVSSMGIDELRDYGKVLLDCRDMLAQAAQQSYFQAPEEAAQQSYFQAPEAEAALWGINGPPAPDGGGDQANYFLSLQQQDVGFAGYDFNFEA